jgi:hypothetical protein
MKQPASPPHPEPKKDQHRHSFDPKKREELLKRMKERFPEASEEELLEELKDHGM